MKRSVSLTGLIFDLPKTRAVADRDEQHRLIIRQHGERDRHGEAESVRQDAEKPLHDGFSEHAHSRIDVRDILLGDPRHPARRSIRDGSQFGILHVLAGPRATTSRIGTSSDELGKALVRIGPVCVGNGDQLGRRRANAGFQRRAVSTVAGVLENLQIIRRRIRCRILLGAIGRAIVDDDHAEAPPRHRFAELFDGPLDRTHFVVARDDHAKVCQRGLSTGRNPFARDREFCWRLQSIGGGGFHAHTKTKQRSLKAGSVVAVVILLASSVKNGNLCHVGQAFWQSWPPVTSLAPACDRSALRAGVLAKGLRLGAIDRREGILASGLSG